MKAMTKICKWGFSLSSSLWIGARWL